MTVGDFLRACFGITKAAAAPVRKAGPAVAVGAAAVTALATPYITQYEGFTNPKTVNGEVVSVAIHQWFDPKDVITFCQGLTNYDDKTVRTGQKFSKAECDARFAKALERYYGYLVHQVPDIGKYPVTLQASQLSVIYNIGEPNYSHSSMKRNLVADKPRAACNALPLWNKAAGKVLKGLVVRRESERKLCLKDL